MKKTLALAVVLSAFTAGAFAQASAPMASDSASAPMMKHSKMKSAKKMTHKKTDKGAMPASAASGAM